MAKNTAKGAAIITTKPAQTITYVNTKPNGNTVTLAKDINRVKTTTTKDVVLYDAQGKPSGEVAITKNIITKTVPRTRTVYDKNGDVISQRTTVRTSRNVRTTRVVTPYSSPDYSEEVPSTPVVSTNPGQTGQVRCVPGIDGNGQIVPPISDTGVTYIPVGSIASTQNGSVLAQTWRSPRTGIVSKVAFSITDLGVAGDLKVLLCGTTASGEPDLANVISAKTVLFADLAKGWLQITLEPAYVQKGLMYAFVLVSTGAHTFETAFGGKYSQGTFFFSQDAAWFAGDLDTDLGMRIYFAEFPQTQIVVSMNPVDLAGGIGGVAWRLYDIVPDACDAVEQFQINGVWTSIEADDDAYPLANLPAQVLYRRVLTGTKEVMPMINMGISRSIAFRSRTDFTGVTKEITTGAGVTTTHVTARLLKYVEANHDCVVTLIKSSDNSVITHAAVADKATDDPLVIERTWTFTHASMSAFRIKVAGTTNSALDTFGVEEILYICS